ncbi:MAG: cyclic nucleotide-binding domain-containing protein [Thermodesulfobacteriota bacterium]
MRESRQLKANEENLRKLLSIPVLKEFELKDLEGLLRVSKIRQYAPGELIIKEGEIDRRIYFLINGSVRITKNGEDLSFLRRRGDLFGEMGAISENDRSASVYAVEETVCLATDTEYIGRLSGNDKIAFCYILYRGIAGVLVERMRKTDEQLANAMVDMAELTRMVKAYKDRYGVLT